MHFILILIDDDPEVLCEIKTREQNRKCINAEKKRYTYARETRRVSEILFVDTAHV